MAFHFIVVITSPGLLSVTNAALPLADQSFITQRAHHPLSHWLVLLLISPSCRFDVFFFFFHLPSGSSSIFYLLNYFPDLSRNFLPGEPLTVFSCSSVICFFSQFCGVYNTRILIPCLTLGVRVCMFMCWVYMSSSGHQKQYGTQKDTHDEEFHN